MNYLAGLKSTALSFHYSEGNNFIKLEHRLKLVKECVSVVWLKTSRLAMSLCKCSGGLWGPAGARRRYYHIRERGEGEKKIMKSVIVIGCAWREKGQNLWMRFPKASWGENWFSLLDGVVNAVKGWAAAGVGGWMKSFSDQWDDRFSVLMPITPDGIVIKEQIFGDTLVK